MKRSGSRGLEDLLGASVKRHAPHAAPSKHSSARGAAAGTRGYGLAPGGHGARSSGGSGAAAAPALQGPAEVCSPPPARPLNFVGPPELPASPFSALADGGDGGMPSCPWAEPPAADRRRQPAADASSSDGEDDWDRENQRPGGSACGAVGEGPATATWLVSPTSRGRPAASAPLAIPSPRGLLSPGMPTPAREAPSAAPASLHHAPSFSSWMVAAGRPPSPGRLAPPDVRDVVANVLVDVTAARALDSRPSPLDALLAQLGDTHYPASVMQWEREELADSPRCG